MSTTTAGPSRGASCSCSSTSTDSAVGSTTRLEDASKTSTMRRSVGARCSSARGSWSHVTMSSSEPAGSRSSADRSRPSGLGQGRFGTALRESRFELAIQGLFSSRPRAIRRSSKAHAVPSGCHGFGSSTDCARQESATMSMSAMPEPGSTATTNWRTGSLIPWLRRQGVRRGRSPRLHGRPVARRDVRG